MSNGRETEASSSETSPRSLDHTIDRIRFQRRQVDAALNTLYEIGEEAGLDDLQTANTDLTGQLEILAAHYRDLERYALAERKRDPGAEVRRDQADVTTSVAYLARREEELDAREAALDERERQLAEDETDLREGYARREVNLRRDTETAWKEIRAAKARDEKTYMRRVEEITERQRQLDNLARTLGVGEA